MQMERFQLTHREYQDMKRATKPVGSPENSQLIYEGDHLTGMYINKKDLNYFAEVQAMYYFNGYSHDEYMDHAMGVLYDNNDGKKYTSKEDKQETRKQVNSLWKEQEDYILGKATMSVYQTYPSMISNLRASIQEALLYSVERTFDYPYQVPYALEKINSFERVDINREPVSSDYIKPITSYSQLPWNWADVVRQKDGLAITAVADHQFFKHYFEPAPL